MKRMKLGLSIILILSCVFTLGVTIEIRKDRTWTTARSVVTAVDTLTLDNTTNPPTGYIDLGEKIGCQIFCDFGTSSGTATVEVFGWPGSGIGTHIDTLTFSADTLGWKTDSARYGSESQTVSLNGTGRLYFYVSALATDDNVTIRVLGY